MASWYCAHKSLDGGYRVELDLMADSLLRMGRRIVEEDEAQYCYQHSVALSPQKQKLRRESCA